MLLVPRRMACQTQSDALTGRSGLSVNAGWILSSARIKLLSQVGTRYLVAIARPVTSTPKLYGDSHNIRLGVGTFARFTGSAVRLSLPRQTE